MSYFYLNSLKKDKISISQRSWFKPVSLEKIAEVEEALSWKFPPQLKEFYKEVGYGCIRRNKNDLGPSDPNNLILAPEMIKDILLDREKSVALPNIEFNEEDMPFLEIGDSCDFLVMRPQSENPNAVYDMWGDLIEKDFETFIHKLYYEAPDYYMKNW